MTEDFNVSLDTACLVERAGFPEDWYTCWYYDIRDRKLYLDSEMVYGDERYYVKAPTQSFLSRWIREQKMMSVEPFVGMVKGWGWVIESIPKDRMAIDEGHIMRGTYQEAFEEGLQKALKMIINDLIFEG